MFRDVAELVELIETPDGAGGYTTTEVSRTVFCNQKSVKRTEFYKAHAIGLKPEISLEMRNVDYSGEGHVRWDGKLYDVLRTHSEYGEWVELICVKRTEVI